MSPTMAAVQVDWRAAGQPKANVSASDQRPPASLEASYQYVAALFQALSAPARVKLIVKLHQGEHCASELAQAVCTSPSNVSQHLALLLSLGFVRRRRRGQQVFYRLHHPYWGKLLAELCATAPDLSVAGGDSFRSFSREAKPQDQRA
jgi:DNA-binding transcriptional ArsR family regulator